MSEPARRGWDFVAAGVAAAAGAFAVGYLRLVHAEGDRPRPWFVGGLVIAAALAAYAAVRAAPRRAEALAVSGSVLMAYGLVAAFSIGSPILVTGIVAVVSALKVRDERRSS